MNTQQTSTKNDAPCKEIVGFFKNTDGAQNGIVSSTINAQDVEKNLMEKPLVDHAGEVREVKIRRSKNNATR